jgi:hypothetical protein
VSGIDKLVAEVRLLAKQASESMSERYATETRPRLAFLLECSAAVAIRATAGEDVTTATTALESSTLSIAREERAQLVLDGRQIALQAAVNLALKLAAAAA